MTRLFLVLRTAEAGCETDVSDDIQVPPASLPASDGWAGPAVLNLSVETRDTLFQPRRLDAMIGMGL